MLNSIGPVWDGNEVWLVTGGGALSPLFPNVYATVFSGFYLALYPASRFADLSGGGHRVPQQASRGMVAANVGR